MTAPAGTKLQINLKGNEPPLVNLYIETQAELTAFAEGIDWTLVGAIHADYMAGFTAGSGLGAETVKVAPQFRPVPQQQAAAPAQGGNQCPHGTRVFKSGTNKNSGKPWAGWFCPDDDKACKPEWTSSR